MREQDKILSITVSALPNSFLLMSLFRESIWYVGGCSALYFGSSCFVKDCVVILLLYTEAGTRTNCSISRRMLNDGRCDDCYLLQSLFLTTERFFFASKLFFLAIVTNFRLETLPLDVFYGLQVSFE